MNVVSPNYQKPNIERNDEMILEKFNEGFEFKVKLEQSREDTILDVDAIGSVITLYVDEKLTEQHIINAINALLKVKNNKENDN